MFYYTVNHNSLIDLVDEEVSKVAAGPVSVIGGGLNDHCDAGRPVTFVEDLLINDAVGAGGLFDSALDILIRDVVGLRLGDKILQFTVGVGISAALSDGDGDLLTDLCENLRLLSVGFLLLILDIVPL